MEESVFGSGPGGQSVNKTKNAVFLKHVPTGLWVKCHETRSREVNQELARKYLAIKVDVHLHGDDSQKMIEGKEKSEKKALNKVKAKQNLELKKAFKEKLSSIKEV